MQEQLQKVKKQFNGVLSVSTLLYVVVMTLYARYTFLSFFRHEFEYVRHSNAVCTPFLSFQIQNKKSLFRLDYKKRL